MNNSEENSVPIIISVGGSLIVPNAIDVEFLRTFKDIILKHIGNGKRFVIICGGGKTARHYQDAAREVKSLTADDLDWLGIHSTRLNGHLVRTIFHDHAHPEIVKNPHEDVRFRESILVDAGWKPGFSTDYDAILLARNLDAKKMVNLSNINYVYDKDPNKFDDAKPLRNITWQEFRKLIPSEWSPGLSSPFDPVASKLADEIKMEVAIINGKNLNELDNYLSDRDFTGTKITS